MNEANAVLNTKIWMERAVPSPGSKNVHTQLGVHLEEIGEMLQLLTPTDKDTAILLHETMENLEMLSRRLKESTHAITILEDDREEYLDSLCDQMVTAIGCAHMSKLDIIGAFNEVNRSNFSKFDEQGNPVFDDNRKIIKGPNYSKPQLANYV